MVELEDSFKEYINEIKKLDTKGKREELLNSIKDIIIAYSRLAKNDNINLNILRSREILDLANGNESEDDFLEASMVYLEVAKNMMGEYLNIKLD